MAGVARGVRPRHAGGGQGAADAAAAHLGQRRAEAEQALAGGPGGARVRARQLHRRDLEYAGDPAVDLGHEDADVRRGDILGQRLAQLLVAWRGARREDRRPAVHLVDRVAEQHQGVDVVRRGDAHAVRPRGVANGLDAVHLLAAEREPPPRVQPVRRAGRDERVVAMMALVDPPLRGGAVQVADRLGPVGGRAGAADQHVGAPRLARLRCGDQVADQRPALRARRRPTRRRGATRARSHRGRPRAARTTRRAAATTRGGRGGARPAVRRRRRGARPRTAWSRCGSRRVGLDPGEARESG